MKLIFLLLLKFYSSHKSSFFTRHRRRNLTSCKYKNLFLLVSHLFIKQKFEQNERKKRIFNRQRMLNRLRCFIGISRQIQLIRNYIGMRSSRVSRINERSRLRARPSRVFHASRSKTGRARIVHIYRLRIYTSSIKRRAVHYQYGGESRGGAEFTRVRGIRAETQYPTSPQRLYSATVRGQAGKPDFLPARVFPEAGKGT